MWSQLVLQQRAGRTSLGDAHSALQQASHLFTFVWRECVITWALCRDNTGVNAAGFLGGILPRLVMKPVPLGPGLTALARVMTACLVWGYVFDIANTSTSVEEDRLNKPHRPIPAGLLTLKQSRLRWLISWCISPCLMGAVGGLPAAVYITCWQAWAVVFYVWPAYRHWLTKNVMTTGSILILLRLLNCLLRDIEEWQVGVQPDVLVCVWTMATIHLQDFRDMEGDRLTHAVTIPLILSPSGQRRLRQLTAVVLLVGCMASALYVYTHTPCVFVYFTGILFCLSSVVLACYTAVSSSTHQYRIMFRWWMVTGFCVVNHVLSLHLSDTQSISGILRTLSHD